MGDLHSALRDQYDATHRDLEEARTEIERLRGCLIVIRNRLLSRGRRPEECQDMCDIDAALGVRGER